MFIPVIYPVPGVYKKNPDIDVTVIIPLYKSKSVIREQVLRWVQDRDLKVELLYVDDKCPTKSGWTAYKCWQERKDNKDYYVKVVFAPFNMGFARVCNFAVTHANGSSLIFLNADTTATPNWIGPIHRSLQDPTIGIVGNLQIREGGDSHGNIDSAGSEWSWEHLNFLHIGKHLHKGELLEKELTYSDIPADLLVPAEREMVTGCCLGIRKKTFEEVGGFNLNYKVGYWEDSDLCLTVRETGRKIIYQPESVIFHKCHHSNETNHDYHDLNKMYFHNKWVVSGRINPLVKAKPIVEPTKISNILVRRMAAHGDVLVASYVLPAIKKQFPDAKLYFFTDRSCAKVLKDNPYIEQVFTEEDDCDQTQYQLTYHLDYAYEMRPHMNMLSAYVQEAGVKMEDVGIFLAEEPMNGLPEKYVVFHAGKTDWVGRNWYVDGFNWIASQLMEKGYKIVSVGGTKGDGLIAGSLDLREQTNIYQLANVIKNAKLFVGIDSFPMHVAQAMNTPGVCFFGCIKPETRLFRSNMVGVTAKNVNCLGCQHRKPAPSTFNKVCETKNLDCETKLSKEEFWEQVKGMLWGQNA